MRRRLPILSDTDATSATARPVLSLPIADPCHADWDAMDPAKGHRKFCGSCSKHVHHLSDMTKPQAETFLRAHAGLNVCVRYAQDRSGEILFRPTAPASHPSRRLAAAAAPLLALAMAACTPHGPTDDAPLERDDEIRMPMGAVAVPDVPEVVEVMGEAPIMVEEPCEKPEVVEEPELRPRLMGKVALPREPAQIVKGDVAVPELDD